MSAILEGIEKPFTPQDLRFLVRVSLLVLSRLEQINTGELSKPWGIHYEDGCEEKGVWGATVPTENGDQIILINPKVPKDNLLETIAHESVHLIQFMKGDVKHEGPGTVDWKGKHYQAVPPDHPDYEKQPWEEEAYRLAGQITAELNKMSEYEVASFRMLLGG